MAVSRNACRAFHAIATTAMLAALLGAASAAARPAPPPPPPPPGHAPPTGAPMPPHMPRADGRSPPPPPMPPPAASESRVSPAPIPAAPSTVTPALAPSDPATDSLTRARASGDRAQLAQALLDFAAARHAQGRDTEAFAAWQEATAIADQTGDDRLGREAARAAADAYDELGDDELAQTWRERADAYRARIEGALAPVAALDAGGRTAATAPDSPVTPSAPAKPMIVTRVPGWLWLVLAVSAALFFAWRRSHQRATALGEQAARLDRHQRHLRSAHQELRKQADHLRQTVTQDALTGALTRVAFAHALDPLLQHAEKFGQKVALMVFDMDHFKAINDGHGHLVGDEALKLVVGVAREKLDSDDLLGRFGGDEFLIAVQRPDTAEVVALAESLREGVRLRAAGDARMGALSLSIGIAIAEPDSGYATDSLFARADGALYDAKRAGRNRCVLATLLTTGSPDEIPKRSLGGA